MSRTKAELKDKARELELRTEWDYPVRDSLTDLIGLVRELIDRLPDDDPPVEFNVGSTDD